MRTCPACAETIADTGDYCPHCGVNVVDSKPAGRKRSAILLFVAGVAALLCVVFLQISRAREAARRSHCRNNLKMFGLALHNYHDIYGAFPPAYFADDNGTPIHSWRIMIQPLLDASPVYNQYNFNEPWNGPNNSQLLKRYSSGNCCPASAAPETNTTYLAAIGKHSVIGPDTSAAFSEITDGTSNTIIIGESHDPSVPWLQPTDVDIDAPELPMNRPGGFNSRHFGGFYVLLADGSARFISGNISPDTFRALLTRDGGETVGEY